MRKPTFAYAKNKDADQLSILARTLSLQGNRFANIGEHKVLGNISVLKVSKHYNPLIYHIEKTNVLHMRKQRRRSGNREADQRLCFRYIDSTIPLLSK